MIGLAKSKKTKKSISKIQEDDLNRLPQNIINVGERVEEDKNIYISQSVYKEIHKFTTDKTVNEAGGVLVGNIIEEFGKINIIINGFIEAKHCEASPTTLKFTHETWDSFHKEIDKRFPNKKILGWIHTHPNYGIFLSEYDKFIQENFFSEDYEVAYVIDPIQNAEGFYFWIGGRIERCKGFYIYDRTGKKIDANKSTELKKEKESGESAGTKLSAAVGILSAIVVILIISVFFLNSKIDKMQKSFESLVDSYNQNMSYIVNDIQSINDVIASTEVENSEPQRHDSENPVENTESEKNGE